MNPELKAKWLTALRSGQYDQGRHRLRTDDNHYCCLGVLCEVSNVGKWKFRPHLRPGDEDFDPQDGDWVYFAPSIRTPSATVQMEGLLAVEYEEFWIGEYIGEGSEIIGEAMEMNDHGRSFDEIADYLEEAL